MKGGSCKAPFSFIKFYDNEKEERTLIEHYE